LSEKQWQLLILLLGFRYTEGLQNTQEVKKWGSDLLNRRAEDEQGARTIAGFYTRAEALTVETQTLEIA